MADASTTPPTDLLPENVLPDVYKEKVTVPTRRYHVGLQPGAPAWNYTFHGVNFPIFSASYDDQDNEFKREGAIVSLSRDQLLRIKEEIRNRVVRWHAYPKNYRIAEKRGQRMRAEIFDVRSKGFEPEKGDEPLVKYVYVREAPPEFVAPEVPKAAFAELDAAIAAAERAEEKASADPADAKTRAKHGHLKATGRTLGDASGAL